MKRMRSVLPTMLPPRIYPHAIMIKEIVLLTEQIPTEEKVITWFELHTNIIKEDRREIL